MPQANHKPRFDVDVDGDLNVVHEVPKFAGSGTKAHDTSAVNEASMNNVHNSLFKSLWRQTVQLKINSDTIKISRRCAGADDQRTVSL